MRRRIFKTLLALLLVAGFFTGLVVVGNLALQQLRGRDRYRIAWSEIDCPAPAGQSRSEFLDEVQYLSQLSDQLQVLEDGLAARLAEAFARHPWVEEVEEVAVQAPRH